jgi:hypothetical protein
VRYFMRSVLEQGVVPIKKDGSLDLDAAYEFCCRSHPQVKKQFEADVAKARKMDKKANVKPSASTHKRDRQAAQGRPNGAHSYTGRPTGTSVAEALAAAYRALQRQDTH